MSATFTLPRRRLLDAVKATTHVFPRKAERPILQTVRLTVNGRVALFATNLEQTRLLPIDVAHEGDASILVHPAQLQRALTTLKGTDVMLKIEQDRCLTIITDGAELTIPTEHKSADYPALGFDADQLRTIVAGRDLLNALRQTLFCCDVESSRYALGGVLFELTREKLTLCATDTRRLAAIDITAAQEGEQTCEGVVPLAACKALLKQVAENSVVTLQMTEATVTFRIGETILYTRLVEGRFPRWRDVIPMKGSHTLELRKADFRLALAAVLTGHTDESRACEFTIGDDELLLKCGDSATGTATSRCVIRSQSSSGRRVGVIDFDPDYLIDYLDALPGRSEFVTLSLHDSESAGLLTANGSGLYVLMPLSREDRPVEVFSPARIVAAVKGATAYVVALTGSVDRQQTAQTLRRMRSNPLGRGVLELRIGQALQA